MAKNSDFSEIFSELEHTPVSLRKKGQGKPIWVADAETDPFKKGRIPKPFIWGVYDGENYNEFTETEDFINFVSENEVILYAHNGGKFDWHFVTDYIEDFEPLTIINGRLAKFNIGLCEFRDSYNIIPAPLSAYKKDDIDYNLMEVIERHKPENWQKISDYLKSDCIYLWEMVTNFIEEYGLNLTQAGAAMKTWSKMSKEKKPNSSVMYYDDMSKYYYGGRVECFQTGIIETKFKVIDINSAYPFAMKSKHPWGLTYSTYDNIEPHWTDKEIAKCFISLHADSHGAFPIRETGLKFPADGEHREFHITGHEYLAARDTGTLINAKIFEVRKYMNEISFDEYVDHFFELKDKASQMLKSLDEKHSEYSYWVSQRLFAKLFLNSLYGKFASNPENYEEFMTLPAKFLNAANEAHDWSFCKLLNEDTAVVNRPLEEEKRRYYDVAVAASITGFVRAYLWRNICACEGILYCDTDSIAAENIDDISCSDKLGDWDIEAECDFAAIGGKKLYAFRKLNGDWKTASKGVRLSADDIIEVCQGEIITYEPEAPTFSVKRTPVFTPRKIRMIEN